MGTSHQWLMLWLLVSLSPVGVVQALDLDRNAVVVTIDDVPITLTEVLEHGRQSAALAPYLHVLHGLNRVLNDLVQIHLLVREGERLDMRRDESDSDSTFAFRVRSRLVRSCPEPESTEVRRYYDENPGVFSTPRYTRARRIGIEATTEAEFTQVSERLVELRDAIMQGELSFAEAVAEHSDDQHSKERQGDLGFFPQQPGTEPPLAAQLHAADVNTFVGPVIQGEMVFLYEISGRHEPVLSPFDESIAQESAATLKAQCFQSRFETVMNELKERWPVVYVVPELAPR